MGYVLLQGREPFDLAADRLPSADTTNGLVTATVPIYAPGLPGNLADVRILLNPQQAEDLGRQLLLEAKRARGARASPSRGISLSGLPFSARDREEIGGPCA